jgi:hypothetical protein
MQLFTNNEGSIHVRVSNQVKKVEEKSVEGVE